MIKIKDLTPKVYSNMSRDFQFIERLFDVVLNYLKTSTETVYTIPNIDALEAKFTELLALSLGFYSKRHYNENQLKALCKVFSTILRNKGNITAFKLLINTVLSADKIVDKAEELSYDYKNAIYHLAVPAGLSDITLILDVLEYILPAGVRIDLARSAVEISDAYTTPVNILSDINIGFYEGNSMAQVASKKDNTSTNTFFRHGKVAHDLDKDDNPIRLLDAFTTNTKNELPFKIQTNSESGEIIDDTSNSYVKAEDGKQTEVETSRSMVGAMTNQEVLSVLQANQPNRITGRSKKQKNKTDKGGTDK